MKKLLTAAAALMVALAAHSTLAAYPDVANDPNIDPEVRSFLDGVNKNSSPFWTLPGPQVRAVLSGLQEKTKVDMSGVTTAERTILESGRTIKLYIIRPVSAKGSLPVILFIHGGVRIAGDFENHRRLVRDLVVETGAAAVFVECIPIPEAIYPTQIEQSYAAAKWVVAHGKDVGVDGTRMAVAGNSVGGDTSAALTLMAKDRGGPRFCYQVLLIPATDTNFDTVSYRQFATGRFLARAFMQYGWNIYAPDVALRHNATDSEAAVDVYATPLEASVSELKGLPPALVITAENDPLRDEGEAYARKLKEAGVSVIAIRYNGMIHDFVTLNGVQADPAAPAAIQQASDQLRLYLFR